MTIEAGKLSPHSELQAMLLAKLFSHPLCHGKGWNKSTARKVLNHIQKMVCLAINLYYYWRLRLIIEQRSSDYISRTTRNLDKMLKDIGEFKK